MKSGAWLGLSRKSLISSLVVAALLGTATPCLAQGVDAQFRQGVSAFEEGRYEDAERAFTEVLKANPSNEEALAFRNEAGYKFWIEVMARGGRLATLARRLLKRAEVGALKERQDEEKMRAMIKTMLETESYIEQFTLAEKLVQQHGHYTVPLLVEVLGDPLEAEKRVRAITYLTRLGDEGVLALVELLEASDKELLRQNAAIILGYIRDRRAIPALQRTVDSDTDGQTKAAASEALSKMGWSGSAADAYSRLAEAYYKEYPLVMQNGYAEWVFWKWRGTRLTREVVRRFEWNERVAEELCYDGLGVEPDNATLWAQLLCVVAQQVTEAESSLLVMRQMQDRGQDVDGDLMSALEERQGGRLRKGDALLRSAGREALYNALNKALEDNNAPVAVKLIESLLAINVDGSMLPGGGEASVSPVYNPGGLPGLPDDALVDSTLVPEGGPEMAPTSSGKSESAEKPAAKPAPKPAPKPASGAEEPKTDAPPPAKEEEPKKDRPRVSQAFGPQRRGYAFLSGVFPQNAAASGAAQSSGGGAGASLCAALTYGDKRVRFAAAMALARLNPQKAFANFDKVVENLSEAVSQSGQRVILVVEPEQNLRNEVVGKLRSLGYMVYGVESGNAALVRLKAFPAHDMVIVSSELNKDGAGDEPLEFQFVRDLREDYRTRTIKIMVLTPPEREREMQTLVDAEETVVGVVTPGTNTEVMRDMIQRVFSSDEAMRDEKARADKVAEDASMAIASLQDRATELKIEGCVEALLRNCTGRPDTVRIAAMKALAAIGPRARDQMLPTLLSVFKNNSDNAIEVRVAACFAIGEAVKGSAIQGDAFNTLKAAAAEDATLIWQTALQAAGKADLTGAQRYELFSAQRLGESGAGG